MLKGVGLTCNNGRLVQRVHEQASDSCSGGVGVVGDGQLEPHVPACHGAAAGAWTGGVREGVEAQHRDTGDCRGQH